MSDMNDAITAAVSEVFHYVLPGSEIQLFTDLRINAENEDTQNLNCWDLKFATVKDEYGDKTIFEVYVLVVEKAQHILASKWGFKDGVFVI